MRDLEGERETEREKDSKRQRGTRRCCQWLYPRVSHNSTQIGLLGLWLILYLAWGKKKRKKKRKKKKQ